MPVLLMFAGNLHQVTDLEIHDDVVAATAGEHEHVVVCTTEHQIVSGTAVDDVCSFSAEDDVTTITAFKI